MLFKNFFKMIFINLENYLLEREREGSDGIVMKIRRKVPIQKTERNDTSTSLVYLASNFW